MVVLLDEQFLVHSAVHRAVLRLLRTCVGDDIQEQLDGRSRVMGAAGNAIRGQPSEYEEDRMLALLLNPSRLTTVFYSGQPSLHIMQSDSDISRAVDDILS